MIKVIFIGNESPFLKVISASSGLRLIVCDKLRGKTKKYFGSSFDFAVKNRIATLSPKQYFKNPLPADIIIVSGFHKLIPKKIISKARIGIVNIHQSLLPAYRGRHPLNWAIINGEKYTGITIHHINEEFDCGNIILQDEVKIEDDDTVMDIYFKTVKRGENLLRRFFDLVGSKEFYGFKQNAKKSSYYPTRNPPDSKIDWNNPAIRIKNLVRALAEPYPGAYFYYKGKKIVVDKAKVLKRVNCSLLIKGKPVFLNGEFIVKTREGYLRITKIRNENFTH